MSLGTNICRLRTAHRLSQEALADQLRVSRQSVSKWETDASVPDLDKLLKLSEVFQVSLDELVKGDEPTPPPPGQAPASGPSPCPAYPSAAKPVKGISLTQKRMGIFFLALYGVILLPGTLLGGLFLGVALALLTCPLVICGTICLKVPGKRVGLWCFWWLYACVTLYLQWATGITIYDVRYTPIWTPSMNYLRLFIAWLLFLSTLAMLVWTVLSFRKGSTQLIPSIPQTLLYALGCIVWLLLGSRWCNELLFTWHMEALFIFITLIRVSLAALLLTLLGRMLPRRKRKAL